VDIQFLHGFDIPTVIFVYQVREIFVDGSFMCTYSVLHARSLHG